MLYPSPISQRLKLGLFRTFLHEIFIVSTRKIKIFYLKLHISKCEGGMVHTNVKMELHPKVFFDRGLRSPIFLGIHTYITVCFGTYTCNFL